MFKYNSSEKKRKPKDEVFEHDTWAAACAHAETCRRAGYRVIRRGLKVIIKSFWDNY